MHYAVERVVDAVYAIAYALDASLNNGTSDIKGTCNNAFDGRTLKDILHRVSFSSPNQTFKFDENGNLAGRYDLKS